LGRAKKKGVNNRWDGKKEKNREIIRAKIGWGEIPPKKTNPGKPGEKKGPEAKSATVGDRGPV